MDVWVCREEGTFTNRYDMHILFDGKSMQSRSFEAIYHDISNDTQLSQFASGHCPPYSLNMEWNLVEVIKLAMLEVTPVTFCQGLDDFLGVFVMQNPASTQQIKMLLALMGLGKDGGSKSVFCLNRKKRSQEGKVKD